jgi:hypothetical protein
MNLTLNDIGEYVLHHLSFITYHHPSSIIHHLSSLVTYRQPSSIIIIIIITYEHHHLSSKFHHPSSQGVIEFHEAFAGQVLANMTAMVCTYCTSTD